MDAQMIDVLVRIAGAVVPLVTTSVADVQAFARAQGADDETLARLAALWQAGADDLRRPVPDGTGQP